MRNSAPMKLLIASGLLLIALSLAFRGSEEVPRLVTGAGFLGVALVLAAPIVTANLAARRRDVDAQFHSKLLFNPAKEVAACPMCSHRPRVAQGKRCDERDDMYPDIACGCRHRFHLAT